MIWLISSSFDKFTIYKVWFVKLIGRRLSYHAGRFGEPHGDPSISLALKVYIEVVRIPHIGVYANKDVARRRVTLWWVAERQPVLLYFFYLLKKLAKVKATLVIEGLVRRLPVEIADWWNDVGVIKNASKTKLMASWFSWTKLWFCFSISIAYPIQRRPLVGVECCEVVHYSVPGWRKIQHDCIL